MFLSILILVAGLAILVKGADLLVDGASSMAKKLKIPYIVIGLVIVAFGTSFPELMINILASARGNTDLAIGNVIGSNITNLALILGIAAAIYPLTIKAGTTWKEIPLAFLAVALMFFMANDIWLDKTSQNILTRTDGIALIAFFIIFLYYTYGVSKLKESAKDNVPVYKSRRTAIMIIGGIIGLGLGGELTVRSATHIAEIAGLSEALIGLTIVAIGTSLPELAASVVAALKRNPDIAVGNIVGSNIFNIFWVLGLSSVIRPIAFSPSLNADIGIALILTCLLFIFMFIGKRRILKRWQGIGFLIIYVAYLAFVIIRG
ncbi:calcium/sodium antiporter [Patescibacteria group bacterium]|nr:calcium/sodium antiporter [Patescibacteria group bacterium]MBU1921745.1 calcium/sodium antiporter [Patescibacteria group bacterium]